MYLYINKNDLHFHEWPYWQIEEIVFPSVSVIRSDVTGELYIGQRDHCNSEFTDRVQIQTLQYDIIITSVGYWFPVLHFGDIIAIASRNLSFIDGR